MAKLTHTPPRSVRVPDDLWDSAKEEAALRGETVTDVVNRALRAYVSRRDHAAVTHTTAPTG